MVDIVAYSLFELASAFAPTLKVFLITRALFGIAMGGEWGVGAALAFETLPAEGRGFFSGLLQEGYVVGYLMAAIVYGTLFPILGWRGMFVIGALPAFLVIYIRSKVDESPAWLQGQVERKAERRLGKDIASHAGIFVFLVILMFAFNSFSHVEFTKTSPQCGSKDSTQSAKRSLWSRASTSVVIGKASFER